MLYVNIYSVGRSYGGPEEGGWYFDVWHPIGSIPVELTEDEWQEARQEALTLGIINDNGPILDKDTHTHSEWCKPNEYDGYYDYSTNPPTPIIPHYSGRCYEQAWRNHLATTLRRKAERVAKPYKDQYSHTGKRSSVLGGDDYDIRIEDHFAEAGNNYSPWE